MRLKSANLSSQWCLHSWYAGSLFGLSLSYGASSSLRRCREVLNFSACFSSTCPTQLIPLFTPGWILYSKKNFEISSAAGEIVNLPFHVPVEKRCQLRRFRSLLCTCEIFLQTESWDMWRFSEAGKLRDEIYFSSSFLLTLIFHWNVFLISFLLFAI